MKLLRRHKAVLLVLGIYWPVIFWLTHIPVPDVARQSGMSDKTMHVDFPGLVCRQSLSKSWVGQPQGMDCSGNSHWICGNR
jgi:hypothetical protein